MYLDGVRLNEPFGDTINWDLIPTNAIRSVNVIPGSNPIFGLNTLGGALSIETKNGFSDRGRRGQAALRFVGTEARARERRHARREVRRVRGGAGLRRGRLARSSRRPARSRRSCRPRTANQGRDRRSHAAGREHQPDRQRRRRPSSCWPWIGRAVFTSPDNTKNQLFMAMLRGERPLAPQVRAVRNRLRADQPHAVGERRPARLGRVHGDGRRPLLDRRRRRRDARARRRPAAPVPFSDTFDAALQPHRHAPDQLRRVGAARGRRAARARARITSSSARPRTRAGSGSARRSTVGSLNDDRGTTDLGFLDPGLAGGGRQRRRRSRALRQRHVRRSAATCSSPRLGAASTCRRCLCAISSATI